MTWIIIAVSSSFLLFTLVVYIFFKKREYIIYFPQEDLVLYEDKDYKIFNNEAKAVNYAMKHHWETEWRILNIEELDQRPLLPFPSGKVFPALHSESSMLSTQALCLCISEGNPTTS